MAKNKSLSQAALNQLFDSRLNTIETLLSQLFPGFDTDIIELAQGDIATSGLSAADIIALNTEMVDQQTKVKAKKPK